MKKVLTFSLIVLLASPMFVGCKSGSSCLSGGSCFTRNGSRVPTSAITSSYNDGTFASTGAPVVNAANTGEIMMMNTTSAYGNCAPCAPTQCNPCAPCEPCSPCGSAPTGSTASGYPAGAYAGM